MHSDKKRCADTLSFSRQAEQNRAEERVSIDTKKGSKYNKSNEKRGGGIQLKKRKWKFRIAGGAVTLLGIYLMAVGYGETITLTIATVVLIFGIAIWSMATPENYNSMTDMIAMISMEKPRKIEEFYEAYKNVDTPFGSAWLAKFYTMRPDALVFRPRERETRSGFRGAHAERAHQHCSGRRLYPRVWHGRRGCGLCYRHCLYHHDGGFVPALFHS